MLVLKHCCSTVESQYNETHYSVHLSIVNATKAIVARAITTKKEILLFKIFSCNVISYGFHYSEYFTMANTFRSQSVRYTEVLL